MSSPIQNTFNQNNQFPITTSKIEQKASPISQKNSFWSPAKIGMAIAATFTTGLGYLTYQNLGNKNIAIDPPISGTIPKVFAGLFAVACLGYYANTKRNSLTNNEFLQKLSEKQPINKNEPLSVNEESQETLAQKSVEKWAELSRISGYDQIYGAGEPDLSDSLKIYNLFKTVEDQF